MNNPDNISLPPSDSHRLTTAETERILAIVGDKAEIAADFAGISEDDAVELITILQECLNRKQEYSWRSRAVRRQAILLSFQIGLLDYNPIGAIVNAPVDMVITRNSTPNATELLWRTSR